MDAEGAALFAGPNTRSTHEVQVEFVETLYEKRGHVAYLTLNREDAAHAFNVRMCKEIEHIMKDFRDDDDMRVMVVTATGTKYFCAGVDVKESRTRPMGHIWLDIARVMEHVYKPIVCAVNGMCVGGGLHLVIDSDILIGSENAVFLDSHVNVGLISGWEPIGLSRRMPLNYVLRMALEGKSFRVDAETAMRIGLLTEVVPAEQLNERAAEIADRVAANAPIAVRNSKKAIKRSFDMGITSALEYSAYILKEAWGTEDVEEGARAFAEKRQPQFKGR